MAKPFKKLSATGLAAALVASSIVPAVSAETPAAAPAVQDVVVKQDGKLISISMDDYSTLLGAGKTPEIAFITLNNGETFDIEQFGDALGATLELNKALTYLADEATPATPENVLTGSVDEKGNIVADQTPSKEELIQAAEKAAEAALTAAEAAQTDEEKAAAQELIDAAVAAVAAAEKAGATAEELKATNDAIAAAEKALEVAPVVEDVKAVNLTTVKVIFDKEVEGLSADNFKIDGLTVTAATTSDDKKEVFLTVKEGFKFETDYKVSVTIDEKTTTHDFTSVAVTDVWELQIDAPESLKSDGVDTGVVTFKLLNKETGEVDTKANDVVLAVTSTYGYLSQQRVTIQKGEGQVILRSEFKEGGVDAKLEAQVIEAAAGSTYKELIGKVVAAPQIVPFTVGNESGGGDTETIVKKKLVSANTNEADRVTLTFDTEVEAAELYNPVTGEIVPNVIIVKQGTDTREVVGYKINPDNKKSVLVYLDENEVLTDNKDVKVDVQTALQHSNVSFSGKANFKFADARTPNLSGVESVQLANGTTSNKKVIAKFTEPVTKGVDNPTKFIIDGRFVEVTDFTTSYGDVTWNPQLQQFVDKRNEVVIELTNDYQEPEKDSAGKHIYPAGFFKPGKHSLQVSSINDFAALTDSNNLGTTQSLAFTIDVNASEVQVEASVDSPEQFRVDFDLDHDILDNTGAQSTFKQELQFQVWDANAVNTDGTKGAWLTLGTSAFDAYFPATTFDKTDFLEITPLKVGSYKIETTTDWTEIYDTQSTKNNYYNDEFRFVLPKGSVVTAANGKKNAEDIVLPLTKALNSPLATPDTKSPEIVADSIKKAIDFDSKANPLFDVQLTEPVKLFGQQQDEAGDTLAQAQTALPETKVEFIGKDKDGKTRTFIGSLVGYKGKINKDIQVQWNNTGNVETPQDVVDAGGSEDWTLVIRSVVDDVGNTAATTTGKFTLTKTPTTNPPENEEEFKVLPTGGNAIGDGSSVQNSTFAVQGGDIKDSQGNVIIINDTIEITFSEAVSTVGLGSATDVKNYALNGKDLPVGASIALGKDANGDVDDKKVVITLAPGTLKSSNIISLAKNLESASGKKIKYDVSFTFIK